MILSAPYGIQLTRDTYEDGALKRRVGTIPNHTTSSKLKNAELIVGRKEGVPEVKVRATKNIKSNDEMLEVDLKGYNAQKYPLTSSKLSSIIRKLENNPGLVELFLKEEIVLQNKGLFI